MSFAKYIINIDELAGSLGDRDIQINAEVSVDNLERLLNMRFDEALSAAQHRYEGYRQCSHGVRMDIPALAFDYELLHSFEQEVYLTGVTYSQTGWKPSDRWSLYAGEDLLFDGLYTKELGEHKRFNVFRRVPEDTELKIVHHNNSGNSKRIWFDIEYLIKQ